MAPTARSLSLAGSYSAEDAKNAFESHLQRQGLECRASLVWKAVSNKSLKREFHFFVDVEGAPHDISRKLKTCLGTRKVEVKEMHDMVNDKCTVRTVVVYPAS